ncbi:hypothetical protein A2773_01235 [Candidatus Gottesmanbacteria bacterium RIFCSPHIGHO2_01_FULL_39_10]|uniref:Polyprenyl synthetase n=1 Tax=Candidatus Gottesmanbacteria bacterium RIFCSPHIGHO2_01_FULL_39_10 TaxID=1798375 RepID=A0A1F5ZRB4_9BACT|nr:MAG: hypothetical protein A2773_01235 [Candidatus Gottesmanbacteria bacterium RIFCSPHIGHO2_01_FULL_39_10]
MASQNLEFLSDFNHLFTPVLASYFAEKKKETANLSPVVQEAVERIERLTLSGGKRIRPALLYHSFISYGGKSFEDVKNYCLALELLHSWALIHDDIMDRSHFRRGQSTVNAYYEEKYEDPDLANSLSILAGDLALSFADELFYSQTIKNEKITLIYSQLKKEVIYGQIMDVTKAKSEEEVLKMIEYKTAGYSIEKPLLLGALLGGADSFQLKALSEIGLKTGLAFQIQDDILGVFGDEETLGKPVDSDMKEGKMTLLVIKTLSLLNSHDKKIFLSLWGNPKSGKKELGMIKKMITDSKGLSSCLSYYNSINKDIDSKIASSKVPISLKNIMLKLVDLNKERQK